MSQYSAIAPSERLPEWLRRPIGNASELEAVQGLVKSNRLHTICEEGRCPNRGECYAAGTATLPASAGSTAMGAMPLSTWQNAQLRVQIEPPSRKVAVPAA